MPSLVRKLVGEELLNHQLKELEQARNQLEEKVRSEVEAALRQAFPTEDPLTILKDHQDIADRIAGRLREYYSSSIDSRLGFVKRLSQS